MLPLFTAFAILAVVLGDAHNSPAVPSYVPARAVEPTWKAPPEYLNERRHDVISRDHGCVEIPKKLNEDLSYVCVNIWLKNKFSETQVKPVSVFLDFEYAKDELEHSFTPVTTWVENINPWRIRGCVAHPGGHKHELEEGKLRWLAIYDTPQSNIEQHGIANVNLPVTTAKYCMNIVFPQPFTVTPTLKFQVKLKYGYMTAQDAMVVWGKGISNTAATVCMEEFYAWSRYHHEFEIHWYGLTSSHTQDQYSTHGMQTFAANEPFPSDHRTLNHFYCRNVTIAQHYPCPAILVQAVEQNTAVCESALVAWVAYQHKDFMTVCYADKRGIMGVRKTAVDIHYIIYGHSDPCLTMSCPANQECIHPTWNTAACGCYKECKSGGEEACGTNMKTYENRCKLEKEACESGFKFSYAHHGKCEGKVHDHGRVQLASVPGCDGLYCSDVSTGHNVWYEHAKINVQISVNWMNSISGSTPSTHDATASWVENVTPNGFKACVMVAGRKNMASGPHIGWFAYQGEMDKIMTSKIEAGEWRSGTHCVPIHERVTMEKPMPDLPPSCPVTDLLQPGKVEGAEDRFHYDSGLMSRIHGNHQHEWFKRMMTGYGVKKLNLTNGMQLKGATLMLTVEHENQQSTPDSPRDAVNAWMEYDGATQEAYVCLREMQNWDGKHTGINVHWTLFMDKETKKDDVFMKMTENKDAKPTMSTDDAKAEEMKEKIYETIQQNELGFIHKIMFKPAMEAPESSNYAFCQTKKYLPGNFSLANKATILVSLGHNIPAHAAFESMKKFQLHQMEVYKGMPIGNMDFNEAREQKSWMMPHMWRANLTGWRPHMRIAKNTDYSAWVEGMNETHVRVCQKSVFTGMHYEGVHVNMMVFPDRCPSGYVHHGGHCAMHTSTCTTYNSAVQACTNQQASLVTPEDAHLNVFLSYASNQAEVWVGKNDVQTEGTWVVEGTSEAPKYNRWAVGQPASSPANLDCGAQGGRALDFYESAKDCAACFPYTCGKAAPQMSCDFPEAYCKNGGKCMHSLMQTPSMSCQCVPPYTGPRCETKP